MKILITGGSGFIGRNLVEYLSDKYEVLAPTHQELDFTDEIATTLFLKNHYFDVIIHAAVRPGHRNSKDPTNQLFYNMRMFINILRNNDRFGKLILTGSGSVYDIRENIFNVSEDDFDKRVPNDEHGFSRYLFAKYAQGNDRIIDLRLFGIFGKYEDYAIRFISNAICKTIFDLPISLRQNRVFSYLYIDDFMPIVDYFIVNNPQYNSYNIVPTNHVDLLTIAEKVRSISGKDLPIVVCKEGFGLEYTGNNQRLLSEMNNISFSSIDSAIKKLYGWYSNNKQLINRDFLLVDK